MIITQAPFRVSFLGGGSDFPEHFTRHGGAVLATAIDRFAYVTVQRFNHEFFDHNLRLAYRRTEAPQASRDVEHPAIRACLQHLGIERGIELHHMADLPARTGLGSSSAFVVGMLQALHVYGGRPRTRDEVAREAIHIERAVLAEPGGHQDQVIVAHGGTCLVRFPPSGEYRVTRLGLSSDRIAEIGASLLLVFTRIERDGFAVQDRLRANVARRAGVVSRLAAMAERGAEMLAGADGLSSFGHLLHDAWRLKRELSDVSLPEIDRCYERALEAGAWGGKLLGAGGGGFLLLVAPPERHDPIRRELGLPAVTVGVDAPGVRVIFTQPDGPPSGTDGRAP
jgi:D-glycero-alpha-D-manno-heptose-7-phosphate kinase